MVSNPLLSFYLIRTERKRQKRNWLSSIEHYPTDWLELKMLLEEIMFVVHRDFSLEEAFITLEKHVPGRSIVKMLRQYKQGKIPVKREFEAVFKVTYNPRLRKVEVKDVTFNWTLNYIRPDFWRMERGIQYRTPPLIPREHRDPMDAKGMVMDPSGTRYPDYKKKPRVCYSHNQERTERMYSGAAPKGLYTRTRKERRELAK